MGRKAVLWCNGLKRKPTESATSVRCKKRKGTSDVELDENESDEDTSQTVAVKKRKTTQEERENVFKTLLRGAWHQLHSNADMNQG